MESGLLRDPRAPDDDVVIVEYGGLPRSNGALRLIKGDEHFVFANFLQHAGSRLMPVPNFHGHAHGHKQIINRDKVQATRTQRPRIKMLAISDDYLLVGSIDLDYVKRRSCRYPESLPLAHRIVVDPTVFANHFPTRRHQFA